MSLKDFSKRFKRSAARRGLFAATWIIGKLPLSAVRFFITIMVTIAFQFTIKLRRIAGETLSVAFGDEKTEKEKSKIIKDCFAGFGKAIIELIYYIQHPEKTKEKVFFEGMEHIDEALKQGKGVVAVSAHFGNFALMQLAFACLGYKVSVIMRKARDKKIAEYSESTMNRLGVKVINSIPSRRCVQHSLKALRRNEIVFVLLDQNFGSESGVFVDFFGQKAATGIGPVVFADSSGAPIIPLFCIRQEDDTHKVIIEPPFPLEHREDKEEMIFVNISKITKIIEGYIRRYPKEWGWMHRRWKSKQAGDNEK